MLDISKALAIPGWMLEEELNWLAQAASESKMIVEIGSWRGRSTRALADNTTGTILAVDTWSDDAVGIPGYWTCTDERPDGPNWLWREFHKNLADHIGDRVLPLRKTSKEGAAEAVKRAHRFDMIFIDASHDAASVREDIELWRPLLLPGGKLCGHDYDYPLWPEVKTVVDEMCGTVKVCGTIWCASNASL
jgi:hypothetical protein